jgi:hypothetical protein
MMLLFNQELGPIERTDAAVFAAASAGPTQLSAGGNSHHKLGAPMRAAAGSIDAIIPQPTTHKTS